MLVVHSAEPCTLAGAALSAGASFVLDSVAFHLALDSSRGSEHAIDGVLYSLEAQLMFFDATYFTFANATLFPGAATIVSVLYQVGPNANGPLSAVTDSILALNYTLEAGLSAEVPAVVPSDLLVAINTNATYFTYKFVYPSREFTLYSPVPSQRVLDSAAVYSGDFMDCPG